MKRRLDHRRVLAWLIAGVGVDALVVASNSLLIGYLRSRPSALRPVTDSLECLVGLGFSGLVCLPLLIVACYLHQRSRAASPSSLPRWLVWVPLALLMPLGLWLFLTYLFGDLGIAIRAFTTSIFEPA